MDTLFQLRDEQHQRVSAFKDKHGQPSETGRPRRLPTLIKILTGFDDIRATGQGSARRIIANREKAPFATRSHEDTVKIAAASAANAVWLKSTRIFGNNRLSRVNSEWRDALRWIASWDSDQITASVSRGGIAGRKETGDIKTSPGDDTSSKNSSEGDLDNFVDDLARLLDTCISQCLEDEYFEHRTDQGDSTELVSSIGSSILKSVVGWFVGTSLPKSTFFIEFDTLSSEATLMAARTFQLIVSWAAVCAFHSSWTWLCSYLESLQIEGRYSALSHKENPEWLVEHEREIQSVKRIKAKRKKKKKKKRQNNRSGKTIASSRKTSLVNRDVNEVSASVDNGQENKYSISDQSSSTDGIPSVIAYSTTSVTSSPSIKPSDSRCQISPTQFLNPKGFPVPSQEQREKAARRLREYQNAQIQRLILRRKLLADQNANNPSLTAQNIAAIQIIAAAQRKKPGTLSKPPGLSPLPQSTRLDLEATAPPTEILPTPTLVSLPVVEKKPVLRPPPGFAIPSTQAQFDPKILSEILDDDDDEDIDDLLHIGMESLPMVESSLDPSAAPFIGKPSDRSQSPSAILPYGEVSGWKATGTSLTASATKIKGIGVYGGSVW